MNVRGRWLRKWTTWRKISLNTWRTPDNATIYGLLDIDVGALQQYLEKRTAESGVKCTLTHATTRALALLLKKFPECNVLVRRRRIWLRDDVDIFHQVAMPEAGGKADLSGATIRQADTKSVVEISRELKERAEKVRAKKDGEMAQSRGLLMRIPNFLLKCVMKTIDFLTYTLNLSLPSMPRDPFGGAMVTSVGMFGIKLAYAPLVTFSRVPLLVLVGQVEERPVVRDGQIIIRPICSLTATLDHRVIDGFQAAQLASEMKRLLENPEELDAPPLSAGAGTAAAEP